MKKILIYILVVVCGMIAVSCTTTKYVDKPYEVKSKEYVYQYIRDSIYLHDSTSRKQVNDTVLIEKWHTRYRDKLRVDTLIKTDSVPVPYKVIDVQVTNILTWWQKIIQAIGYLALGGILVYVIIKIRKHAKL